MRQEEEFSDDIPLIFSAFSGIIEGNNLNKLIPLPSGNTECSLDAQRCTGGIRFWTNLSLLTHFLLTTT